MSLGINTRLTKAQKELDKFNRGMFEIAKILKENYCCNDPTFRKALTQKIAESGNENLSKIVDVIVTKL